MSLQAEWKFVLFAVANGEMDFESSVKLFERLTSTAAQNHFSRLLIDGRFVTGSLRDIERAEIGEALAKYANKLSPKPRIAVVGPAATFNRLAVTVARKLDFDVELFEGIPEALQWLSLDMPLGASAGAS